MTLPSGRSLRNPQMFVIQVETLFQSKECTVFYRKTNLTIFLLILSVLSLAVAGCQAPAPAAEAPSIPAVSFTATETGFSGPDSTPAGWTRVELTNQGEDQHQAQLFRFLEGKTMNDLAAALQGELAGVPEWLASAGGPTGVMPGASASTMVNLEAGDYVVIDVIPGPDGIPHAAKGLIKPFSVTAASGATAQAPDADLTVELVDYQFKISDQTVAPGDQTIKVVNTGTEPHELSLIELAPGASVQDFLAAMASDAPAGPPPGMPVGGIGAIATDSEAYFTANLEAGKHYGLLCFIPSSNADGAPHFMMGMVAELAVEG